MARKSKPPELDFLDQMEELSEKKDLEKLAEGVLCHSPSEITDAEAEDLWVKSRGWTPLEFLTHTFRNPWTDMRDRISAARSVLEYVHRKLPQRIEVGGEMTQTKKITAEGLGKLSDAELEIFTKLLEKLGNE